MPRASAPRFSRLVRAWLCVVAALVALGGSAAAWAKQPVIVLIGGAKQGYPAGEHDYPEGIMKLQRMIAASPRFAPLKPIIKVFPAGFPKDPHEIDDADVVLLYFGMKYGRGGEGNSQPLEDGPARQEMDRLMARGVGLVALHQSFTVPASTSSVPFQDWLGAVRVGMADRSTEVAPVEIAGGSHPVATGLHDFSLLDEYYPTIEFSRTVKVTPILKARTHVQMRDNKPVFEDPAMPHLVAWAAERANGGRSFAYSGGHYLAALDQPQISAMLLNALLWTARLEVPPPPPAPTTHGMPVADSAPAGAIVRAEQVRVEPQPWGKLEWFASRALGNSTKMTLGRATLRPGQANPLHWHPNCDEILRVVQGRIVQTVGDKEFEMRAGDTITIPEGTRHRSRNVGPDDAVLEIAYNSADRITVGE